MFWISEGKAYVSTEFSCDPMRPWLDTEYINTFFGVVVYIERIWLEHCLIFTISHWEYHLRTCLKDAEELCGVNENKIAQETLDWKHEGFTSTCHSHADALFLLNPEPDALWHEFPKTLALTPAATLPRISVPDGAPSMALHILLTGYDGGLSSWAAHMYAISV